MTEIQDQRGGLQTILALRGDEGPTNTLNDRVTQLAQFLQDDRAPTPFKPTNVDNLSEAVKGCTVSQLLSEIEGKLEQAYEAAGQLEIPLSDSITNASADQLKQATDENLQDTLIQLPEDSFAATPTPAKPPRPDPLPPPPPWEIPEGSREKLTKEDLENHNKWLDCREWLDHLRSAVGSIGAWQKIWLDEEVEHVVQPSPLLNEQVEVLRKALSLALTGSEEATGEPVEGSLEDVYDKVSQALDDAYGNEEADVRRDLSFRNGDPAKVREARDQLQSRLEPPPAGPSRSYLWFLLALGLAFCVVALASTDSLRGAMKRLVRTFR